MSALTIAAVRDVTLLHRPGSHLFRTGWDTADLRIANLEAPLCTGGVPSPKLIRLQSPPEAAEWLRGDLRCVVVSLANNHIMDWALPVLAPPWRRSTGLEWPSPALAPMRTPPAGAPAAACQRLLGSVSVMGVYRWAAAANATAWRGIVTVGRVQAAERLLVVGASGGVGCAALQIGMLAGAGVGGAVQHGSHRGPNVSHQISFGDTRLLEVDLIEALPHRAPPGRE
jgi:hypothetical protein